LFCGPRQAHLHQIEIAKLDIGKAVVERRAGAVLMALGVAADFVTGRFQTPDI
jgi:hypothetical protein